MGYSCEKARYKTRENHNIELNPNRNKKNFELNSNLLDNKLLDNKTRHINNDNNDANESKLIDINSINFLRVPSIDYSTIVYEKLTQIIGNNVTYFAGTSAKPSNAAATATATSSSATASLSATNSKHNASSAPLSSSSSKASLATGPVAATAATRVTTPSATTSKIRHSHYHIRHSLCLYAASSVILALCYLTSPIVASSDTSHPM